MGMLAEQFRSPKGLLGVLFGRFMAWQNKNLNWKTIVELKISDKDVILEIGFGTGAAIHAIHSHFPSCKICGIDPSEAMVKEGIALNKAGIDQGTLILIEGRAEDLPFAENHFNKAFSVSTFHDWQDRATALIEIRRVLKKDGKLVICLRKAAKKKWPWVSPGLNAIEIKEDLTLLRHAGFRDVTVKRKRWNRILLFSGTK
jgi:ubiquinone/menaquinone biosynthesis C-methylase UbiE